MVGLAAAVAKARAVGLDVQAEGDRLIVRGARRHADLARGLLVRKAEVLGLLAAEDAEVAWRMATMRQQIPPRGPIPFLIASDMPVEPGCCQSCGDVLGLDQRFRCRPCLQAASWVLDSRREQAEA